LRRRMCATLDGVIVTDNIYDATPRWYAANSGIPAGDYTLYCWKIMRDPWHWWTTGGTDKTLWGIWNDADDNDWARYIYKHTNFPRGTWAESLDANGIPAIGGATNQILDIAASIETANVLYALVTEHTGVGLNQNVWWVKTTNGGTAWSVIGQVNARIYNGGYSIPFTRAKIALAGHSSEQIAFVAMQINGAGVTDELVVMKTTDGGVTWAEYGSYMLVGAPGFNYITEAICPYVGPGWNDRDVLVSIAGNDNVITNLRKTTNGGTAWSSIASAAWDATYTISIAPGYRNEYAVICIGAGGNTSIYRSSDGGGTWTTWATLTFGALYNACLFHWNNKTLESAWVYDGDNDRMVIVTPYAETGKTGNFLSLSTTFSAAWSFERDSIGGV